MRTLNTNELADIQGGGLAGKLLNIASNAITTLGGLYQAVLFAKLAVANFQTQGADGVIDHLGFVCTEEQQVAVFGTGALQNLSNGLVMQVFHDG